MLPDPFGFTLRRPHFGRWVPPSCQAGFNRSTQRTQREPATPGDVARVEAAKAKRARKGRA